MRILYGVVGEGMGHATRSRVVVEHLLAEGHDIHVMVSGRAHAMLQKHFSGVHKIHGWHLVYEDNTVKKTETALANLEGLASGIPQNVAAYFDLVSEFRPEVVVSDFESWTWTFGRLHRVPVVSVDNMQVINRCEHPDEVLAGHKALFLLAKGIVKSKLPGCRHYVVTTFFEPPVCKERTTLVPPILRPEVIAARPSEGDHVLVYSSADSAESLENVLKSLPDQEFVVYGLRRGIQEAQQDANLQHQPFSEQGFVDHLASAKAVVAGGGFSLMSECVYLHKPVLSVPLEGQFEQILNARWLELLGYGLCREHVTRQDVGELLARAGEFRANLGSYVQDGNRRMFAVLDGVLGEIARGEADPAPT
jgi:uncharacterized protein (TIGR00661 family)